MSMQWWDATRPDIGYQGMMPGRSDITEGESSLLSEAGFSIGAMRESLERTETEVRNQGQVLEDYGQQLPNKVEAWAVPTVAPLSATINRRADPTFQLSDFMVPLVRGTSDAAGHNHQHTTTSSAYQLQRGAATKGRAYLAFITPAINRAYEQLNFMVSEATSPCRMDVAIYVVSEDRTLTRQVLAQDVGAGLSLSEDLVTVTFPRWVATQGSYIAVVWLQTGDGNPRSILGLDDTPRPLTNLVFPRKISAIHTSTAVAALPASIDGTTQVDFGFWFTPYAELSEDLGVELRLFTEPWPNVGSQIGRPWVPLTPQGIGAGGGYTAAWGLGTRVSMYDTPLSTDKVHIRTSINRLFGRNCRSTIIVRGSNDLRSGVGLAVVDGFRYELVQWSGRAPDSSWSDRTVVRTLSRAPAEGDVIEVEYLDGQVTVRINGATQFADQPVSSPAGAAGRFVGIQAERTGNVFVANPSPWLGPWTARDLPLLPAGDDSGSGEGTP